jgi:hypothetical protein
VGRPTEKSSSDLGSSGLRARCTAEEPPPQLIGGVRRHGDQDDGRGTETGSLAPTTSGTPASSDGTRQRARPVRQSRTFSTSRPVDGLGVDYERQQLASITTGSNVVHIRSHAAVARGSRCFLCCMVWV